MKYLLLLLLWMKVSFSQGQKIYLILDAKASFSGLSASSHYNKEEFKPSVPTMDLSWKSNLIIKTKKIIHKISFEQSTLGKNFKIINKFSAPPNINQLGFVNATFGTGIDHFIASYNQQRNGKKNKGFLFKTAIRFKYAYGLGISFNRSKKYYEGYYSKSEDAYSNSYTYVGYQAMHHRKGIGLFLMGDGGIDFINKKNKPILSFSIFYSQGLISMVKYDIHYQYGYYNDPSRQVDVAHQILKSKGTSFGLCLGIPIILKK